jgi:hypothetical protein
MILLIILLYLPCPAISCGLPLRVVCLLHGMGINAAKWSQRGVKRGELKPKEISPPQRQFDDLLLVIFTPWRS